MPNLLPAWTLSLPWGLGDWHLRASGRMAWAIIAFVVGLAFVMALIKPPVAKRPFPTAVGVVLFPIIVIVGLVAGKLLPDVQRGIVWLMLAALVAHGLLMVASRTPRDPEQKTTWSEAFAGALGAFAMFTLGYAIIPSEWLTFANSGLQWGDNSKFVFTSHEKILGLLPVNYPFNLDFPAMRDIVVTIIYVVVLGANIKLFSMWQKRNEVKPEPIETETAPARSRFGRPLRAWSARRAEAGAGVPGGA